MKTKDLNPGMMVEVISDAPRGRVNRRGRVLGFEKLGDTNYALVSVEHHLREIGTEETTVEWREQRILPRNITRLWAEVEAERAAHEAAQAARKAQEAARRANEVAEFHERFGAEVTSLTAACTAIGVDVHVAYQCDFGQGKREDGSYPIVAAPTFSGPQWRIALLAVALIRVHPEFLDALPHSTAWPHLFAAIAAGNVDITTYDRIDRLSVGYPDGLPPEGLALFTAAAGQVEIPASEVAVAS